MYSYRSRVVCPIHKKRYPCPECRKLKRRKYVKPPHGLKWINNVNFVKRPVPKNKVPGIYGIFEGDDCLYIGQSIDVGKRITQHKQKLLIAKRHLASVKTVRKYKVEKRYYDMADLNVEYYLLYGVNRKYDYDKMKLALTYLEQKAIDKLKPELNVFAARISY